MSREFRARGSTPFDIALHWIEHVGRHKAGTFIRPPTQPYRFIRMLNLDFLIVVAAAIILPLLFTQRFLSSLRSSSVKKEPVKTKPVIELDADIDLKNKKKC